jgi:hypothetical protein
VNVNAELVFNQSATTHKNQVLESQIFYAIGMYEQIATYLSDAIQKRKVKVFIYFLVIFVMFIVKHALLTRKVIERMKIDYLQVAINVNAVFVQHFPF